MPFTDLQANHVELCHNNLSGSFSKQVYFTAASSTSCQIIIAVAQFKFFTIAFDGTDALVDLQEEVCSLEVDIELGRLAREKNDEFCSLLQRWQV